MFKVYSITDIGNVREYNQDGFLVDGIRCEDSNHREIYYESDSNQIHVAICDGVGSTSYATEAVRKAQQYISNQLYPKNEAELKKLVEDMNTYVFMTLKECNMSDAACTISGVIIIGEYAYLYNVGDSSIYSINNGYLEKHSIDDTGIGLFGEASVDNSGIAIKPPLLQSIATNETLEMVHVKKLQNEKSFLLCTDGITDMMTIDEMEEILESSNSMKEIAQRFVFEANSRGGYDNSTVVILVDEED